MQLPLGKMHAVGAISPPLCASSSSTPTSFRRSNSNLSIGSQFNPSSSSSSSSSSSLFLSTSPLRFSLLPPRCKRSHNLTAHAASSSSSSSSVGKEAYAEEPATKVKFLTSLTLPGCSSPLSLVGTGYREKVFAIIGVKVYAAGVYMNQSIFPKLNAWKGKSVTDIQEDESLFTTIFQAPLEKSLQIVLVRDIDGKTFWDALDDAVTPRITLITPVDQSALSRFRSIFQGRSLNKGTIIFLTWLDSSKMLVSVSSDGMPTGVEAMIESQSVTSALFDVFLGDAPVSPSLKASVANGLATVLK